MKTTSLFTLLIMSFVTGACGQQVTPPTPTPYAVVSRTANSAVWERTIYEPAPGSKFVSHKERYVELATGLNHLVNGNYVPSSDQIQLSASGTSAAATNGQQQAYFPNNIATGTIKLITPGGLKLVSRPIALAYEDGSNTVLIALLTNSVGEVLGHNNVVYPNAFQGVSADLRYTYTKAAFEQNIVLKSQPPSPAHFGLDPQTTKLQVITEFFNPPQPEERLGPINPQNGLRDTTLKFGRIRMIRGRAFLINGQNERPTELRGTPTYKSWLNIGGRSFLIESVPCKEIDSQLQTLPTQASASVPRRGRFLNRVSSLRNLLKSYPVKIAMVKEHIKPMHLVQSDGQRQSGVLLDYVAMNSSLTNYTFQGNTTYFISGTVNLFGTTTFEGGAVIKYTNAFSTCACYGIIQCQTASYRPVVFTSQNDNTVGAQIANSTGTPTTGSGYYLVQENGTSPVQINNMRFCYAGYALVAQDPEVWNSQFVQCANAVDSWDPSINASVTLYNVLFSHCGVATMQDDLDPFTLHAEQITADQCNTFQYDWSNGSIAYVTNSIITASSGIPLSASNNPTVAILTTNTGIYQVVGGGSYYLANNSPYRNAGTTNIPSSVLNDLAATTTYPPVVYSNITFTTAQVFSPQAQRDTDIPDLGYHYDPIDYFFGGCIADSNLTFTAGTAAGWFQLPGSGGTGYGIALDNQVVVNCEGTATSPCVWAFHDTVQEGGDGLWSDRGYLGGMTCNYPANSFTMSEAPHIVANFTRFYELSSDPNHFRDYWTPLVANLRNCELFDGGAGAYNNAYYFTNCLFENVNSGQIQGYNADDAYTLQNCTLYGGLLQLTPNYNAIPLNVHDCSIDGTTLEIGDDGTNATYASYDYNAFTNGAPRFPIGGTHDVTTGSNFDWQTGPLGDYYLPTGSPLVHAGDVLASQIGLYHFTVQTNLVWNSTLNEYAEVPDGTNIVSIGYHYVAVDANGVPLDSNGDGIPDYLEDANGNGVVDSGEIGWNIPGDLGLKVIITQPRNGSIFP